MEQTQPQSLLERALSRLKKLAAGNGLDPASFTAFESQEQIYTIKGKIEVSPMCDAQSVTHAGGPRSRGKQAAASFAALQGLVENHQKEFRKSKDWVEKTVKELKSHESKGWGLQSAKVTLPEKSAIFTATETCPSCQGRKVLVCEQCQGKGLVTCTQCQGLGRELCYYCNGRGEDPQNPGQRCFTCEGTRYATCRFCQLRGLLPCPTCGGNRGTPCAACQATGAITQEVEVTCGATTHFTMVYENLPSGLRRGLDRIRVENLGNGHADITVSAPPKKEDDEPVPSEKIPVLFYEAVLPYAEMKINLGGKKALVSAVGKRCVISGVPNFLDLSLKPWRDKLHLAAFGQGSLEAAVEARALNEILALCVAGKGTEKNVRKIYPFGMSSEVIGGILSDMRLALKKTTLVTRTIIAFLCGGLAASFFYAFFIKGLDGQLMVWGKFGNAFELDLVVLLATLGASWIILNFSTRLALQLRFQKMSHTLQQKIGKTGITMFAGIVTLFVLFLFLAPVKPLWLIRLLK